MKSPILFIMLPSPKTGGGLCDVSIYLYHIAKWCYKQNVVPLTSLSTSHVSLACLIMYYLILIIIRCCFFEFCLHIQFALFWRQQPPFSHFCVNQEFAVQAATQFIVSQHKCLWVVYSCLCLYLSDTYGMSSAQVYFYFMTWYFAIMFLYWQTSQPQWQY